MSRVDVGLEVLASPERARSLLTVRAAISSAVSSSRPRCSRPCLMCSYCRSRLALHAFWGMTSSFRPFASDYPSGIELPDAARLQARVAGAARSRLAGGKEEVMATKQARVSWKGDLENGTGTIEQVGSGAIGPLAVSWAARTGDEGGLTSPEELIAAAHASCFSMAFSARLAKAGTPAERRGGVRAQGRGGAGG